MAASVDFFSRFRQFGSNLERDCNELKERLEEKDSNTDNEGRCHLVLREILSEVTDLKGVVNSKAKEAKQKTQTFGEFLDTCERLAEHTKRHLDVLEDHLVKYGYKKTGDLPSVDIIHNTHHDDSKKDTSSSSLTAESSQSSNSEEDNDVAMEINEDVHETPPKKMKLEEDDDDPMKSPVRPTTYIPMIQCTPLMGHTAAPSTPLSSPQPPQTTTPMIKTKTSRHIPDIPSTPESETPEPPQTTTPMIKSGAGREQRPEEQISIASPPHLPAPPMFTTPGLKLKGAQHATPCQAFASPIFQGGDDFGTPAPPDVTSVVLLRPEDCSSPKFDSSAPCTSSLPQANTAHDENMDTPLLIKPVEEAEHESLTSYIKKQFSVEILNDLLYRISRHLARLQVEDAPLKLSEEELQSMFSLGRKAKAFMLALVKLGRAKVSGDQVIFVL